MVVSITALALAIGLVVVDVPEAPVEGGAAARYVPLDGHRTLTTRGDGVITVTEHSRTVGLDGVFDAPASIVNAMFGQWGDRGVREAQLWRASRTEDGGARTVDLYRLSELGVSQIATWGGELGFVFEPELVLLSSTATPGDSWSSQGDALPGGVLTYTAAMSVVPVTGALLDYDGVEISQQGGCVGVQATVVITDPSDGASTTLEESTAWCAGRGPVWSTGSIDGESAGLAELTIRSLEPLGEPVGEAASVPKRPAALVALPETTLQVADGFFGDYIAIGQYSLPVSAAVSDLVLVDDRGDSLESWALDDSGATRRWSGRPGGTVVSAAAVGDLTLATTDRRQVAAYDALGRRLWSTTTDEVVVATPAGAGADPVVVTRAGNVLRLDARTGAPLWSVSLGADGRGAPVPVGDIVLAADERERLSALDADSGDLLWRIDAGLVDVISVSQAESLAVLAAESGTVLAVSLADGEVLWRSALPGLARSIVNSAGAVLVVSNEVMLALDSDTGAVLWRGVGAQAAASAGEAVVVLLDNEVQLRDIATGFVIDRAPVQPSSPGVWRSIAITGATVVVVDSTGVLRMWEVQ